MKTRFMLALVLTQFYSCCYGCDDESDVTSDGLRVTSPQIDGFAGTSVGDSFFEDGLVFVELRSARGDGMVANAINIEGSLEGGRTYDTYASSSGVDVSVIQDWRPHIGEWGQGNAAQRVVLDVSEGSHGLFVEITAYFNDAPSMRGSFEVSGGRSLAMDGAVAAASPCGRCGS